MTSPAHDMEHRGRAAADIPGALTLGAPEPSELVRAAKVRKAGRAAFTIAALVLLAAVAFGATSVTSTESLRWVTGVILVVLLASTWLLCAHAGGHAWFVPLPALLLAALWAVTVTGHSSGTAWWLVAMSAAAAALGIIVGTTALRQQLRSTWLAQPTIQGASGAAVTTMSPVGVVRVAGETWTAKSLSGSLPAGAPVHVVRVDGVRLEVWSEDGAVPSRPVVEGDQGQR